MKIKKFHELNEAAEDAVQMVTLITDDGERIEKEGYAEEGVGIFDYDGKQYPAAIGFNGEVYGAQVVKDDILKLDGKGIVPGIKMNTISESKDMDNMKERDIIIEILCPFYIKKYNDLMKWAKKKTLTDAVKLKKFLFEKRNDGWAVVLIAPGWSYNESNRITTYLVTKEYKNFADKNGINMESVNYSGGRAKDNMETIEYDVERGIEI